MIYHINCGVIQGFPTLRKAVTTVRNNFLTLVVQLTISFILSFITQVITTGTSSDLSRKVWVTAYKGDTYGAELSSYTK